VDFANPDSTEILQKYEDKWTTDFKLVYTIENQNNEYKDKLIKNDIPNEN